MPREILIDPVTRIEGHAKITLRLDDDGEVSDAMFHVTQFRGFEKFAEGRPMTEMPALMARTCGICPVSHLITGAKACDALLAVEIPPTAAKLRRILHLAQNIQSHALSFFHLSAPDFVLGFDSDPAKRHVFGLAEVNQAAARDGIRLRSFGQQIIEVLGGKKIHPSWTVPGGVNDPITAADRDKMLAMIPEMFDIATRTIKWFKSVIDKFPDEAATFANFPSYFMGTVTPEGDLEHYDGGLRMVDSAGKIIFDHLPAERYHEVIGEAVEPYSFMKFPYYKGLGYPDGMYRVGPLARLIVADRCGTERADIELKEFRQRFGRVPTSSLLYHYARLIEIIYGIEIIKRLLESDDILDKHVRARARPNRREGIGVAEAPRGTLIHHYKIDENGLITWANLVIATGHNNLAMNRGILQAAKKFVDGKNVKEGALNRVEHVIRCFDPCLSCATHAVGQMPLRIELTDVKGKVLDVVERA
ncbi:MAG: Ni/Fe hydrogenase subunit alpha [Tepidisphaeraceae bacterium]